MRILIIIAIVFIYACTTSTAGNKKAISGINPPKKVLLELFTSQGCSSCPPADKLISQLAASDSNLVVVSFHVDYWDRLGWKDVFSSHDYTVRQQQYVQALHAESVYTPQAVVQGQFEMVGSNQPGVLQAIKTAGSQSNDFGFEAGASFANHTVTVHYQLSKAIPSRCQVNAVLVQNHSATSVARGENRGKQLTGYHVARAMITVPANKNEDNLQLTLPDDVKPENASVVIFIQDVSSRKILAVTQLML